MQKRFFYWLIAMLFSLSAFAAETPSTECEGIKIATGPTGKGYSKLFVDIQKACNGQVTVCEVTTGGGLDNLNALATNQADIGLAQIDTVMAMQGDDNIKELLAVASLNNNYLHVIASVTGFTTVTKKYGFMKEENTTVFHKVSELKGMTIAAVGSVSLLARKLSDQLGVNWNIIDAKNDKAAFDMVIANQAHAMMTVSGWPSGPVNELQQSSNLTMIPWDMMANQPYSVKPLTYKNLGVYNVNSLAIPNVLMTRPFGTAKAIEVSKLKACIKNNLQTFRDGAYQPGWKEVKDMENVYGWNKFIAPTNTVTTVASRKK